MANEKRLIDANAFQLDPDPNGVMNGVLIAGSNREQIMTMAQLALKSMIDNAPTVDAVEVVHGRWLYDSGSERYFCSACHENALSVIYDEQVADYDWEENLVFRTEPTTKEFLTDYCPNCGAKMDGDGNENP